MITGKYLVRPIQKQDLSAICDISTQVGPGFVSLPNDSNVIQAKIQRSLESFALKNKKESRLFFFVFEDLQTNTIVGTCALEVQAGHLSPFYCYKLMQITQHSLALNIQKKHTLLSLVNDFQEASLYCTLYLDQNHRGHGQGEFLSRVRGLFIATFPDLFSDLFIASLRGIFNEKGVSPFWDGLGRHFCDMDFHMANYLYATHGSQFITDLAPANPIYLTLLSHTSQRVMGKAHERTKPALHVLEKEGFTYRNYVDFFDGGPLVEVYKKDITTVREAQEVVISDFKKDILDPTLHMISNISLEFRATLASVEFKSPTEIFLEPAIAELLKLEKGNTVKICAFR